MFFAAQERIKNFNLECFLIEIKRKKFNFQHKIQLSR